MSANISNIVAYLRTTRSFPDDDVKKLSLELNKAYLDTAACVNSRTIGLFPTNKAAITGEQWFLTTNQQQTLRQVFPFGAIAPGATLSIPYKLFGFSQFTRIYGTCITSLPDYRPIPYASVAANGNIDLRVDNTDIIINNGAGAQPIVSGLIILEWLSQT